MTLNQIVKRLKTISLDHHQVRSFYYDQPSNFLADKTVNYPGIFVSDTGGSINPESNSGNISFKIFFLDLVNVSEDSKTNETDVLSDMLLLALDIVAQIKSPQFTDWKISGGNTFAFVTEEDGDMYAGVSLDITVSFIFSQNRCQVPSDYVDITPIDNDMKLVYDLVYVADGTEGTTLSIPAIVGKKILGAIIRGGIPISKVSNNPDSSQFTWNDTTIGLPFATSAGERFVILYRNY